LAFLLTERKNGNGNFSKLELWVIVLSIPSNKKFWDGLGHLSFIGVFKKTKKTDEKLTENTESR